MSLNVPMSSSTANWHWRTKNTLGWAREWFEQQLPTLTINGDGEEFVKVDEVTEVEGDCELGQRKSKLIAIYDCKIELKWSGKAADGTEVNGKLLIPEVSHEITLDQLSDYQYNWTLSTASTKSVDALYAIARKRLPIALEAKFAEFPSALLDTHGKDILVVVDSNEPSRTGTPSPAGATPAPPAPAPAKKKETAAFNTSAVTVEASFMASADDLYSLLTDEKRIPQWTRAPAQSKPEAGGSFALFGGNVKGTYVSVSRPTQFVQKWSLVNPRWPTDHFATLTTTLDQSSESTTLKLSLNGVPKGMEEEIENNLKGYYIHGFKSIGLGSVL